MSAAAVQYKYDSRNKRIWRSILSAGNLSQEVYFYSVDGQKIGTYTITLAFYSGMTNPQMTDNTGIKLATFFGGKRLGTYDRLGTAKFNQQNSLAQSFYPYGEDRGTIQPNDSLKFATYTRDTATGLDYADQRYYANNFGRFMSPDPSGRGTRGSSPSTLNQYSYVLGDPINYIDPRGLYCVVDGEPLPMDQTTCEEIGGSWVPGDCGGAGSGFTPGDPSSEPLPCGMPSPAPPPPQAQPDCKIALYYRPVEGSKFNHAFIVITGTLGTWTVEGEPSLPFGGTGGVLTGNFGVLLGYVTPGSNGFAGGDDPKKTKVSEQGSPLDDPGCSKSIQLLGFGKTEAFNAVSGAPKGGWRYQPFPECWGGVCNANSNTYAHFLLDLEDINFGVPPNAPGWDVILP